MPSDKIFRIGVVGPRPFGLGGHDWNSTLRVDLRKVFVQTLKQYQQDDRAIVGITGLGLGTEQDFADACLEADIDYLCYLPFNDQEYRWINIPEVEAKYQWLLGKALQQVYVNEGNYSPKKIMIKNQRIIRDSDLVFVVYNKIDGIQKYISKLIADSGKLCVRFSADTNNYGQT